MSELCSPNGPARRRADAFTLAEVVVCIAITALLFMGMITAYFHGSYKAEWSGYSLAAQAQAIQQLEQAKSAVWDNSITPAKIEITNLLTTTVCVLDLPINGTNVTYATNFATISQITLSTNPVVSVYMVQVDTVWPFTWQGNRQLYTNSIADYYAPDTPDQ
jgi:hypothetical protein